MNTWAGYFSPPVKFGEGVEDVDQERTILDMTSKKLKVETEAPKPEPNCNTFVTTGFHLDDVTSLMGAVREAVKLYAQEGVPTLPDRFVCSHCGNVHGLTAEEVRNALFNGPGSYDFVATYDEFLALLGWPRTPEDNSVSGNSEIEISQLVRETQP